MQRPFPLALQPNKTNLKKKPCPDLEEHVDSNKEGKALHLERSTGPVHCVVGGASRVYLDTSP